MSMPTKGAVLGIDVGYSKKRKSTGLALLSWDKKKVSYKTLTTSLGNWKPTICELVPHGTVLQCVAIDGPLAQGLQPVSGYRCADALFILGAFQKRGSAAPARPDSPLHCHATRLANIVLDLAAEDHLGIEDAEHPEKIHQKRVVEAHPVPFLSTMIDEGELPEIGRGTASDQYYCVLANAGKLEQFVLALLSQHTVEKGFCDTSHHDERAALVCALTALCIAAGKYAAAGDCRDGSIIISHPDHWGRSREDGGEPWPERELRRNVTTLLDRGREEKPNPKYAEKCRVNVNGRRWFPEGE